MKFDKTGLVFTALLFSSIPSTYAQSSTVAVSEPTTGGLRVQFDSSGHLVQPVPEQLGKQTFDNVRRAPAMAPSVVEPPAASSRPATAAVVSGVAAETGSNISSGKIVRLNGLFHAASRAEITPNGELRSDCHIEGNGKSNGGRHK